eukprot:3077798-Rhodomonas_salina.2
MSLISPCPPLSVLFWADLAYDPRAMCYRCATQCLGDVVQPMEDLCVSKFKVPPSNLKTDESCRG